ncbi:DUF5714 domain-containing protein [Anaerolentibacter hominis]|uniref:DUF5714 domain-containing protein n=1 Tax=Anaerolentibacter hominis TaxID=3079009 RepID=UPI0031B87C2E
MYSMKERARKIQEFCIAQNTANPFQIFRAAAEQEFIRIHGPEHHILDGACILTAFRNAGGKIDLKEALAKLTDQGMQMPGAICGFWGVCGSVTSIGAALAIIDGTGPLTSDSTWGDHMKFTSDALAVMSDVGGPRCCKRNALISMGEAVDYINAAYHLRLEQEQVVCHFSHKNEQCIRSKCPFFHGQQDLVLRQTF